MRRQFYDNNNKELLTLISEKVKNERSQLSKPSNR